MPRSSGRYPSGQRGQTVNLLAYAFGGSNPPLPTTVGALDGVRGNSSAVERQPSKLGVAGSNPVSRSTTQAPADALRCGARAHVAQMAERVLGKEEVTGSNPVLGSRIFTTNFSLSSFISKLSLLHFFDRRRLEDEQREI